MLRVTSSRRPAGLKPTDYDHEISLVDHDGAVTPQSLDVETPADITRSSTTQQLLPPDNGNDESDGEQEPQHEDAQPGERGRRDEQSEQGESSTKKNNGDAIGGSGRSDEAAPSQSEDVARDAGDHEPISDAATTGPLQAKKTKSQEERESTIDILYENQRGGFLCGIALFSAQALGGLDPSPWTNGYHKTSPSNLQDAQVPDPTWEWAWPEWRVNKQEGVDSDGWEYAFAFSKRFSWHGPRWWSSFVRRRAWIRKRVKKRAEDISTDPHMLNTEYFSIQPAAEQRSRSRDSRASSYLAKKVSKTQLSAVEVEEKPPDIENIDDLLDILRAARIDREKLDAVENYLTHAADLERLQEAMHEIMSIFVFQASRRILLSRLMRMYDETTEKLKKDTKDQARLQRTLDALRAAVKHADEEVRKLAYWSDVKKMTKSGDNKDAVDEDKGWDESWQGLDQSGGAHPRPPNAPATGKR